MPYLYVGSARASGNGNCSLHKLDTADGAIVWSRDTGALIRSIAINAGNTAIYCGGDRASSKTTFKYTAAGDQSWYKDHGAIVVSVALDASENLFTCGQYYATDTCSTRKYDSSGTEDTGWRKAPFSAGIAYGVHVGADGNIYYSGDPSSVLKNIYMYNSSGTFQFSILFGTSSIVVFGIRGYSDSQFVICGDRSSSTTTRKYNSDRTTDWSADHGNSLYALDTDSSENVYVGGTRSSSLTTRKYDSAGSLQWSADHGGQVNGICVDADGNVYTAGDTNGGYNIRKYNSAGSLQWSQSLSATCYAIAVEQSSDTTIAAPALAIPLSLGLPEAYSFLTVPAIPIALALGVPTISAVPLPPDPLAFVLPPQTLYRCLLINSDGGLEIPMASFQCRRRAGESTWLSVLCPQYSETLRAAVAARVGAALVIQSGVRVAGVEMLGDFLQSTLTEYEYERQPWGAGMTLTARVTPSAHTATTRALLGVQTRGLDEQGRKQIGCAVDPLLRPGDTATALDWSFEVGAILYFVGVGESWMQITEAS